MLKKILIAVAVLALALALVACGGEPAVTPDETTPTPDVTEHVHVYEEQITASTCTEAGTVKKVCACGDVESEEALGLVDHTASVTSCDADTVCTVCNTVLAPATGHTLSAAQVVTPATCATAGKEKSTCLSCGIVVETDIPATGHVPSADAGITANADGFASTCASCGQAVTLKEQAPVLKLTFDDYVAEMANAADIGLQAYKAENVPVSNGTLNVKGNNPIYINISDPSKLNALGAFVISFDYTSTREAAANSPAASVFSILNNHYNGVQTSAGSVGWGWLIKYIDDADVLASTAEVAKITSDNSVSVPKNTTVKIQFVVSSGTKTIYAFVDGKYIGKGNNGFAFSSLAANNASFRFGDGPDCGHVIDNFTIAPLK